jgi:hypothetical protein
VPRLDLREQEEHRGAIDVRTRPGRRPRRRVRAARDGRADDAVVCVVVVDLVDALTPPVVRAQLGRAGVREFGVALEHRGPDELARLVERRDRGIRTAPPSGHRLDEGEVRGELVDAHPRRHLVLDLVRDHRRPPRPFHTLGAHPSSASLWNSR